MELFLYYSYVAFSFIRICFLVWTISSSFNLQVFSFLKYYVGHPIITWCFFLSNFLYCFLYITSLYYVSFFALDFCLTIIFLELLSNSCCVHVIYFLFISYLFHFIPLPFLFVCLFPFIYVSYWSVD